MAPKVTYWCQTSIGAHIRWCQNPSIDSTDEQRYQAKGFQK